jgi:hypothetical protein
MEFCSLPKSAPSFGVRAMFQDNGRAEIEKRIERYKTLARQIPDEVTVQSIKSLIADLEQTLSRIDDK